MNHSNRFLRMLCCALVVSVLAVIAPLSALADFSAVVTSSSMRVYAACSTSSPSAKLSKGTVVTVKSTLSAESEAAMDKLVSELL